MDTVPPPHLPPPLLPPPPLCPLFINTFLKKQKYQIYMEKLLQAQTFIQSEYSTRFGLLLLNKFLTKQN